MRDKPAWIDISVPLATGMPVYPGDPPVRISRLSGGPEGEPFVSHLSFPAHAGTHVDAPLHFVSHGRGIEAMPLEAMEGPARIIAVTGSAPISVGHLEGQHVSQGERILFKTTNSTLWRLDSFAEDYVYLSTEAALFLAQRRVVTVGIDYLSIGGFGRNESEVHRILLEAGIWIIEGLDLGAGQPGPCDLLCLPLLTPGTEAAPARVMVRPR